MAITAPSVATIISGNMTAAGLLGVSKEQLAMAISTGFTNYIISAVTVVTADVGTLGAGFGFGPGLILSPSILQGTFISTFSGAGIMGPFQPPLIFALSNAISQSLITGTISTNSAGVGLGSGIVVTLAPSPSAHIASMIASFKANGVLGPTSEAFATAVAIGIDMALPLARGFVVVVGPPNIVPGAGVGIGRVS